MKKIKLAIVSTALCAVTVLSGGEMKKISKNDRSIILPSEWKLFRSAEFTTKDAACSRYEDEFLIPLSGTKKVKPVTLKVAERLDLAFGKKYDRANRAVLVGTVYSKTPRTIYIGMGADWWIDSYCNGQYVGGTDVSGNDSWPPTAFDRVFPLRLRAGRNDLSFFVRSGSGSWCVAVDFYESCDDPDLPPRVLPEPGIAFQPYLTNPGADSVTITYLLNGRQPLGLEYRLKGNKKWNRIHLLRAGQIIDETPIIQFPLTGLKPDSTYEYRALRYLPPFYKEFTAEKTYTFRTFSDKPQNYTFFVMGDTQDSSKRKNQARVAGLQKAFPELNKCKFFVHVGDLHGVISHFRNDVFDSVLKLIPSETFIVPARGNHEFEGSEAQQWINHFSYKNNKSYGMFRIGEVCYIVLDTGHHLPKDSKNPHVDHMWLNQLDLLLEEQTAWLKEVVKTPEYKTAKFRIVFAHVSPWGQGDSFRFMVPRTQKMVKDVFKKSKNNIDFWVAGHTHKYELKKADPEWGFPMVVVGGGGPGAEKKPGNALLFDVKPGKITMKALSNDGTVCDTFILEK